jgi:hypothetical protein
MMRLSLVSSFVVAAGIVLVSCSSGKSSGGGGVSDVCANPGDANLTAGGMDGVYEGTGGFSGTVTMPSTVMAGVTATLAVTDCGGGCTSSGGLTFANLLHGEYVAHDTNTLTYAVTTLSSGTFEVFVVVDVNNDRKFDDGDFGGYYAGTAGAVVQDEAKATPITVSGSTTCHLDFAIGPVQCGAAWGQACQTDADCIDTACPCGGGSYSFIPSTCDPSAKTCKSADASKCTCLGGDAGTAAPVQAGCRDTPPS